MPTAKKILGGRPLLRVRTRVGTRVLGGTAIPIDRRGYFLTAAHCVDATVPFSLVRATEHGPGRLVTLWKDRDLALLAGPPTLAGRPFNVRAKKLTDGALVHMIGLPGYGVGSTYEYRLAMVDAKHAGQNGMYAGYERLEGRARRLFGASGGAVLDSNGQLTGVFLASGVDERSVTDFLPQDIIHSLRTYLSKALVKHVFAPKMRLRRLVFVSLHEIHQDLGATIQADTLPTPKAP